LRNEKIGFKIREHTIQRIPYLLVVGEKEVEANTVAVRSRGGEDLGTMPLEAFAEVLAEDVARRGRAVSGDACVTGRERRARRGLLASVSRLF
jgi:threonyl-tRNA synthetase